MNNPQENSVSRVIKLEVEEVVNDWNKQAENLHLYGQKQAPIPEKKGLENNKE